MTNELVIDYKSHHFTTMAYEPPTTITYDEWLEDGRALAKLEKLKNFAIGDWLLAGEHAFGQMYSQALDLVEGGNYGKLSKFVWVARAVPPHVRRPELWWTHHHHVASLPEEEQVAWLDAAVQNGWTTDELKQEIKESKMIVDTTNAVMAKGSISAPVIDDDEPPYCDDTLYADDLAVLKDVPNAGDFWHTNGYQQSTKLYVHCPGCDELTPMPAGAIVAAGVSEWQCVMCETRWAITTTFERVG